MNTIATYTYGTDGDLPDEFMDFYEEMEDVDFTGKIAGVVGSGDTFYEYYCKAVDDFEEQFKKFGQQSAQKCQNRFERRRRRHRQPAEIL